MTAAVYDITIEQGATFTMNLTWRDESNALVDLTGYTARMQVRKDIASSQTLLSLTSGSGITLGGAAGTISITASAATTAAIAATSGVYDLELVSGSTVTRLLQGNVTISKNVTR